MKVLVTGSHGFMGKHLIKRFNQLSIDYFSFDIENSDEDLIGFVKSCDFIVHLAGVMRPLNSEEFYNSNLNLTKKLLDVVKETHRNVPILLASSTQATLDNDYGLTKKMCEDLVFESGLSCYVFRFTNAFGKWGKPNYNSVASTFFYNISHGLDIYIRDPDFVIHFIYIDDIIDTIIKCICGEIKPSNSILSVTPVYDCSIGHLAELINYFKKSILSEKKLPKINNSFELKLFVTFCDYFSDENHYFSSLNTSKGSYEEIFKSNKNGKISIIKVGLGGFYSNYSFSENTLFQTIEGRCIFKSERDKSTGFFQKELDSSSQNQICILSKSSYNIQNIGDKETVVLMWTSNV